MFNKAQIKTARASKTEIVPLRQVKRAAILAAVRQLHGNVPLAAEKLGIGTKTLYRKLKEYGVAPPAQPKQR
jgi:transcriptional regulator of acetoin/glycerol metabolism